MIDLSYEAFIRELERPVNNKSNNKGDKTWNTE